MTESSRHVSHLALHTQHFLLPDLGAITCGSRAQVAAGHIVAIMTGVAIAELKSHDMITLGEMYGTTFGAVMALLVWITTMNDKIFQGDRPVALSYLEKTNIAIADLAGFKTANVIAEGSVAAKIVERTGRLQTAMLSAVRRSLWWQRLLHDAPAHMLGEDTRLRVAAWCSEAPPRVWREVVRVAKEKFQ